ncbi:hypothetical protein GQ607_001264 [Colletotrichum asianum]|uniref:Uncharacterized protein n=1 Tax=Colletotrichum asianum TaxID=702518 RepID=A0A8H3WUT5_9PEZI|nr:hypothetical protein GQ607_001264 [Colletotrichum asianum]
MEREQYRQTSRIATLGDHRHSGSVVLGRVTVQRGWGPRQNGEEFVLGRPPLSGVPRWVVDGVGWARHYGLIDWQPSPIDNGFQDSPLSPSTRLSFTKTLQDRPSRRLFRTKLFLRRRGKPTCTPLNHMAHISDMTVDHRRRPRYVVNHFTFRLANLIQANSSRVESSHGKHEMPQIEMVSREGAT